MSLDMSSVANLVIGVALAVGVVLASWLLAGLIEDVQSQLRRTIR
jgi:hypothetical protein